MASVETPRFVLGDPERYARDYCERLRALGCSEGYVLEEGERLRLLVRRIEHIADGNELLTGKKQSGERAERPRLSGGFGG